MQTNKLLAKLLVNSKSIDGMRKLTTSSIYLAMKQLMAQQQKYLLGQ